MDWNASAFNRHSILRVEERFPSQSFHRVSALLVCRFTGLGAVKITEGRTWVVMGDPSGFTLESRRGRRHVCLGRRRLGTSVTRPVTMSMALSVGTTVTARTAALCLHRQRSREHLRYPCLAMGVRLSARSEKRCRRRRHWGHTHSGPGDSAWRPVRPAGRGAGPGRRRSRCPRRCRWEPGTSRARRSPRDLGWRRSPSSRHRRSPTLLRCRPRTR